MNNQAFHSLHRGLPPYARGAAKIMKSILDGSMGADLQAALQNFDRQELATVAMSWINYCDPYKAPEQVAPCAEAIARYFIGQRLNEKEESNAQS